MNSIPGTRPERLFPDSFGDGDYLVRESVPYSKPGIRQHRLKVADWPARKGGWSVRHLDLATNQLGRTRITIAGHPEKTRLVSTAYVGAFMDNRPYETKVFEGEEGRPAKQVDEATYEDARTAAEGHGRMVKKWVDLG